VQDSWTVCDECNIGSEIILMHLMVLLGDVVQVEVRFGPFEDSVNFGAR
jgi:predicted DsbA family dithiol-disulfide isomerase